MSRALSCRTSPKATSSALKSIRERDEFAMPGGDSVVSWMSTKDIAAVVAVALTEGGHEEAYAPVGLEKLTPTQFAEHLSAAAGRRIRYVGVGREPWRDALIAAGVPPEIADLNSQLDVTAMSTGMFGVLNSAVNGYGVLAQLWLSSVAR